ncbi:hypothetical protein QAD02_011740 [Eretmocerus hayati]|uniref:Uncharacterized protein n=1 Tax=Eretmocerus hayati TaxID=131215 RepID=A0ACC2NXD5_9HYME|nr:hypothetical protein QAD02_011740 [Eretmocerus hayati]
MSMSSEEIYYCTSSSSSSSSSSSGSSCSTGNFSSTTLDSKASTIIATQPCVRPFGCPDYNYFWIENKSKTNPKLSYFYNFKSRNVVWERPVPNDVPLPYYSTCWNPDPQLPSDEDDEDLIVSESEDAIQKKRRLEIKRRNRLLLREGKLGVTQLITCKKTMSKKKFRTLWKLLRNPGETEEDVKKRLFEDGENDLTLGTSEISKVAQNDMHNPQFITIKKEPELLDGDGDSAQEPLQELKCSIDSDSDPEHVSRVIKQEYMMHYADSEMETDNDKDEGSEDKYMDQGSDAELENAVDLTNVSQEQLNGLLMDVSDEEILPISDYLAVDLTETAEEDPLQELNRSNYEDPDSEKVNWSFDISCRIENPLLTVNNPELNCPFRAPKLKQISKKHLTSRKRKKKKNSKKIQLEPSSIDIPTVVVKDNEPNDDGPIVCDMYGTRTINYNHPPKMKVPKWQSRSRLSDSGSSNSEFDKEHVSKSQTETHINNKSDALELKNWFPKDKKRKRLRQRKNSNSSWHDSDISAYSDVDEHVKKLVRMKKEKRSSTPEADDHNDSSSVTSLDSVEKDVANEEFLDNQTDLISREKRCEVSEPKTQEVDISMAKIERKSPIVIDLESEDAVEPDQEESQSDFAAIDEEQFMKDIEKRRKEWLEAVAAIENEEQENEAASSDQMTQGSLEALAQANLQKAIDSLADLEPEYITPDMVPDSEEVFPTELFKVAEEPHNVEETPETITHQLEKMFSDNTLEVSRELHDLNENSHTIMDIQEMLPDEMLIESMGPPGIRESINMILDEERILPDEMTKVPSEPFIINEKSLVNDNQNNNGPAQNEFCAGFMSILTWSSSRSINILDAS